MIDMFLMETGWSPLKTLAVAGALPYSKYNFVLRLLMKHIARKAGGNTDTSRDHEYTNWQALDEFVEDFSSSIAPVSWTTIAGDIECHTEREADV